MLLAAMWLLARWPGAVESVYARRAGFQIARALSVASAVIPVSLAELSIACVAIGAPIAAGFAAAAVVGRRRSLANVLLNASLRLLVAAAVIYTVFQLTWGLNYARAPLASRLGWTPPARSLNEEERHRETAELSEFARQLVEATNQAYREAFGGDDLGRPTGPDDGFRDVDAALEAAYVRVQSRLTLEPGIAAARGRAKPVFASTILNHLRITGFYFPWTGEANYNRLVPAPDLPHSVAHEKAHQRGIAREDEASFLGYLACILSDDPHVRYSGYLDGQYVLLGDLASRDRARARELADLRVNGVQRDVDASSAFWRQYAGAASRVSRVVNHAYIRSQGDSRGVAAYAASRNLILLFARANGGRATVPPAR